MLFFAFNFSNLQHFVFKFLQFWPSILDYTCVIMCTFSILFPWCWWLWDFPNSSMLRLMYLKAKVNSRSTDCQHRVHSTVRLLSQKLQRQWWVAFFGSISTVRFYHPLRAEREIKLMKARIPHSPARKQNKASSGHCCCPAAPVDI